MYKILKKLVNPNFKFFTGVNLPGGNKSLFERGCSCFIKTGGFRSYTTNVSNETTKKSILSLSVFQEITDIEKNDKPKVMSEFALKEIGSKIGYLKLFVSEFKKTEAVKDYTEEELNLVLKYEKEIVKNFTTEKQKEQFQLGCNREVLPRYNLDLSKARFCYLTEGLNEYFAKEIEPFLTK